MVASHVRTRALKNMESSLIQSQFGHLLYQQIPSQLYMIVIIAANKTSVVIYCHVTNHPKAQWLKTRRYIVFHDSLGCVFPLLTSPGFIHIVLFSSWRYWELGSVGTADNSQAPLSLHSLSSPPSLWHSVPREQRWKVQSFSRPSFNIYLFGCPGSQLQYVGSSSLNRDGTQDPCIGSVESQPLDHQGSPQASFFKIY